MRITRIEPLRNAPGALRLHLDDGRRTTLAAEILREAGLGVGDEVDEARLAGLERLQRGWEAREAALRLLAARPRSAAELERRLAAKGFEAAEVEPVVERLRAAGLVDDQAFAGMVARDRLRFRPQGTRRTVDELRGKGVDEATARRAVVEAMEGAETSEREAALRAATKWRRREGEEPLRARRRLHAFLARRGFDPEVAREVVEAVLGAEA